MQGKELVEELSCRPDIDGEDDWQLEDGRGDTRGDSDSIKGRKIAGISDTLS